MHKSQWSRVATVIALPFVLTLPSETAPQAPTGGGALPGVVSELVGRLELDQYKSTVEGLTRFGDRRQGTQRNRDAIDWIESELNGNGCTETGRIDYMYPPAPPAGGAGRVAAGGRGRGRGGCTTVVTNQQVRTPAVGRAGRGGRGSGGSTIFGNRAPTRVNNDPLAQPDEALRELNSEPTTPGDRQEVYCTKVGTTNPDEMYILGAHMDGHGWGEAANDDGSGTAIVMELARIFSSPDVRTERSIRFILWNNEETGLNGSRAYVEQRQALQGQENPPGSGRYPEPRWLGMIQHDMMMFDHGAPRSDGTVSRDQRPEADVNIEFQINSQMAEASEQLAWLLKSANEQYATDYPASVGPHMTNTDSTPFMNSVPAISLRENERGAQIGAGWDPHWHQPTDLYSTFTDDDFRLGLNAAQTTLAAIAQLAGATIVEP